jgi:transcriptional regulator GlxA family with amidase domain
MPLGCRNDTRRPLAFASRREVVERAEAYLHARRGDAVPLSELCRMVGLSERGLRNAFYSVRGMSPKRCMLVDRLRGVRHALSDECSKPVSVTGVATAYGFYELGRFSAIYKKEFGEAPSETLRATMRKSAPNERPNGAER